ncbi:MAG: hypothetical protein PHD48_02330 [Alphaproteobacteria bacterium]|nr:hypothetical protein [Alphaproteobacteria bacterium]
MSGMTNGKFGRLTNFVLFLLLALVSLMTPSLAATSAPQIDSRFCEALVKHVPDADVAYQPGIDVHGRAVVPADLGSGNTLTLPGEIAIPLTVDLMSFLKMDTSALPASAMKSNDVQLGTLTLTGEQVLFNGQPLTNAQQDNLAVLCLKPR